MDTSKLTIEKLNDKNYIIWSAQVKTVLAAKGLLQYIEMDIATPRAADADYAKIKREKNQIIATLL